jgi:prepilin-type N-terminal cleavage/methylation domain-containing protein
MNTTKSRKGFTLIELVVTIVLLGALAAIASVSYSAFLSDARGEITTIEEAQSARIGLAQQLLDQEGQYQGAGTPATPVDGMTLVHTLLPPGLGVSPPVESTSFGIYVENATDFTYLNSIAGSPVNFVVAAELNNGTTVYADLIGVSFSGAMGDTSYWSLQLTAETAGAFTWSDTHAVSLKLYQ